MSVEKQHRNSLRHEMSSTFIASLNPPTHQHVMDPALTVVPQSTSSTRSHFEGPVALAEASSTGFGYNLFAHVGDSLCALPLLHTVGCSMFPRGGCWRG